MLVHGNRGKCAQPCRLPYELLKSSFENSTTPDFTNNTQSNLNNSTHLNHNKNSSFNNIDTISKQTILDKGYLLSTKDLCSLDLLPTLVNLGIKCFKIEGRLKNPEYVATVTRIYRKYIDLALSDSPYIIDEKDKKDLLQVFNRGGFSTGYLENKPHPNLIYKNKPNNMGIFIGTVSNFNNNKGYITLKLQDNISIGDTVSLEKEKGSYTISELMINNKNVPYAQKGDIVKIGRIKGNIFNNDKFFKMSSKELNTFTSKFINEENIKNKINCKIIVHKGCPISMQIFTNNTSEHIKNSNTITNYNNLYQNINFTITSDLIPVDSINSPITKERIMEQINKLGGTCFEFGDIEVDLDDNLYVPSISKLNQLRRDCINKLENILLDRIHRKSSFYWNEYTNSNILKNVDDTSNFDTQITTTNLPFTKSINNSEKNISVLLNLLHSDYDYTNLENVSRIYIPLKYFYNNEFGKSILDITNTYNTYIYMPSILKENVYTTISKTLENILDKYAIKGFVISNISHIQLLEKYTKKYKIIANYNMNIYNNFTINELKKLNVSEITISPELDKATLNTFNSSLNTEAIVYGNTPVMTINYCLISKSNNCLTTCNSNCSLNNSQYYLKDRMNMNFRVIADSFSKTTTIYNSKKTSISAADLNVDSVRLDFMDEDINEINFIISTFKNGEILEGKDFTNGNFNRIV